MESGNDKKKIRPLLNILSRRLSLIFLIAFAVTMTAIGFMQKSIAKRDSDSVLTLNVLDVKNDIMDMSERQMLSLAREVALYVDDMDETLEDQAFMDLIHGYDVHNDTPRLEFVDYMMLVFDLSEIDIVDENGIITESSEKDYIGFDMASGEQSAEFLCLLGEKAEYVQEYRPISFDGNKSMKYAGIALQDGGFVQIAYDAERFREEIDEQVFGATKNRHVGEKGYILIVGENGEIVSCPNESYIGKDIGIFDGLTVDVLESAMTGEPFEGEFHDVKYRCYGDKVEGYYIFALIPSEEMLSSMLITYIMTNVLEALTFIVMFLMLHHLIRRMVINNVTEVDSSLERIADGDLEVRVDAGGTQEFENLSANINTTVGYLKSLVAKEAERINRDLENAKNIQKSALPSLFPPFPDRDDFEIYASMDPAKEVGGDFFDFELLDGKLLGFCVADVSGKGIPAAMFMMRAKTLIKSYGVAGLHADEILKEVNNTLCTGNDAGMFVTCWLGILNTETGTVEYANAGHNPPLIRSGGGDFVYLTGNKPGFVLAGMENIKYKRYELQLNHGDELFLYTDGVTEATDLNNELFGEERLQNALNTMKAADCTEKCHLIRKAVDNFAGEAPQFDDITMMSLKYN